MTGWGVERMPRTAIPASVEPAGVRVLMPPHSQGAERNVTRRPGRTGHRWGLRVLVVGGLAGAAWLLTGAAAHAADPAPLPEGPSLGSGLIGAVVDHDGAPSTVVRVLHAAARPLDSGHRTHHYGTASLLDLPARALSRPAGTLAETLSEATPARTTGADTALRGVDRVLRDLTGPLRLTGGPAESPLVTAPLTKVLRPVTGLLAQADTPVTAQRHVVSSASRDIARPVVGTSTGRAPSASIAGPAAGERVAVAPTGPTVSAWHPMLTDGFVPGRAVGQPATGAVARPETARESSPGGDGPAPLQVQFRAISGLSTSGSGAPTEGGSAAFLPAAVAAGSMACHRLPIATGDRVRRYDAEAPTVSPD